MLNGAKRASNAEQDGQRSVNEAQSDSMAVKAEMASDYSSAHGRPAWAMRILHYPSDYSLVGPTGWGREQRLEQKKAKPLQGANRAQCGTARARLPRLDAGAGRAACHWRSLPR